MQKKTKDEISKVQDQGFIEHYDVFMAMVERVGHDKRGNTLFKRDKDGNEIWEPDNSNVIEISNVSEEGVAYKPRKQDTSN